MAVANVVNVLTQTGELTMGMPNEQEDTRLVAILNVIPSLSRKDVKMVKITFEPVMAHGAMATPLILPLLEVVYKESRE